MSGIRAILPDSRFTVAHVCRSAFEVHVYGDVAILRYNDMGIVRDKDGKFQPSRAESTRVSARLDGRWMLVHANFAPGPLPK